MDVSGFPLFYSVYDDEDFVCQILEFDSLVCGTFDEAIGVLSESLFSKI